MQNRAITNQAILAFILAGVLWGLGFPLGKVALAELRPAQLVSFRFVLATLALSPVLIRRSVPIQRRHWPLLALTAVLTVPVTFLLQFVGLTHTTASSAALIMGASVPLLAFLAVLFYGERLSVGGWLAVLASTVGVALIVGLPGAGSSWLGDALVFLSAVAVAVSLMLTKLLVRHYPALTVTAYIVAIGTAVLLPLTLAWEGMPSLALSAPVWAAVLVLGVGSSALTNLLYNWGLARFDASRASLYLNLEPLVGALLGVTLLGETLGPAAILGGILIIASAAFVSR